MGRIFLTAGHHLRDSGAVGNGYKENALTIEMRDLIAKRIRQLDPNIEVWLDDDKDTLSQVIAKVDKLATPKDLWLEIHFDAGITPKPSGATSLVAANARQASKDIAKKFVDMGSTILGIPNRGVKSETESNRGRLAMLHTKANSVLYEVGFISNPSDMVNHQDWKHWMADEFSRIAINSVEG